MPTGPCPRNKPWSACSCPLTRNWWTRKRSMVRVTSLSALKRRTPPVLLAHTLPASDFKDAKGKQVQSGAFYVYLDNGLRSVDSNALGTDESYVLIVSGA